MRMDGGLWVPGAVGPGTPASGNILYPKSDGMWYTKDSAGVEILVGSKNVPTPSATTDSANKTYVDSAVSGMSPLGQELGYAERTTNYTTTNITAWPTTGITSLSVVVTGTGRPCQIEFGCALANHTTANTFVAVNFIVNGATNNTSSYLGGCCVDAAGNPIYMSMRKVLTASTSYTITVGVQGSAAGTTTIFGSTSYPIFLAVTQR